MKIYEQKEMIGCLKSFKSPMFDQIADEIERLQKAWDHCFNQLMSNETEQLKSLSVKYPDLALENEKLERELEQSSSLNRIMALNLTEKEVQTSALYKAYQNIKASNPTDECLAELSGVPCVSSARSNLRIMEETYLMMKNVFSNQ